MLIALVQEPGMFDRYNEKARRVIFFARFEASNFGSPVIGSEHLLLGLLRESPTTVSRFLKIQVFDLEDRLRAVLPIGPVSSTSVDLPLDDAAKHVLAHAMEESNRLGHDYIGPEHLLLGILREADSTAAEALRTAGIATPDQVRESLSTSVPTHSSHTGLVAPAGPFIPSVRVLDVHSGRELPAQPPFHALPRIGESILIVVPGEDGGRYRVVDVSWEFHGTPNGDDPSLSNIEVHVRREESPTR